MVGGLIVVKGPAPLEGGVVRGVEGAGRVRGTSGSVSARDRESGRIAVAPTSIGYEGMQPAGVSVVAEEGELLEGKRPSTERPMHLAILSGRPEVGSVVHTHSPYATALALMVDPEAACRNLRRLAAEDAVGQYGFYEAVDYAPARLPRGRSSAHRDPVRTAP